MGLGLGFRVGVSAAKTTPDTPFTLLGFVFVFVLGFRVGVS